MTTLTANADIRTPVGQRVQARLSFGGIIRSEWIKLRSLRSTVWSYIVLVALSVGMASLMAATLSPDDLGGALTPERQTSLLIQASTFSVLFGQLIVGVLGVLLIAGEYRSGMIRSSFAAVPTRLPVLAAKAIVVFVATLVVGVVSALASFAAASALLGPKGVSASITDPDLLQAIGGAALYLALVSVFALGVGAIVRSSAAGITIVVGILLVAPTVFQMIPAQWALDIAPYLISDAGLNFVGLQSFSAAALEPWQQLAIVLGWIVVATGAAAVLMKRRDA